MNIKNYIDVTKEWINDATPNSHEIKESLNFKDKEGNIFIVDGKNVVLDYSKDELKTAIWLKNTFGGEIYLLPRINIPWNIKTPDFIFKNEYWDLKTISSSGKFTIDNRINKSKNQTNNYIIDISNNNLTNEEIIKQIIMIYNSPKRNWVNKIILKRHNDVISIFVRK